MFHRSPHPILLLLATILYGSISLAARSSTNVLVDNFRSSASYGDSIKEDYNIFNPPFSNLKGSMKAAPVCLSILGNLNLISTLRDINLVENTGSAVPNYQHLKSPDSLRASLSQLSNAAFWAFNTAHDAMHEINLRTGNVPGYLFDALTVLFDGTPAEVETNFPILMNSIKNVADKCVERSQEVEKKYKKVMLIAQDLNDAALRKQGFVAKADEENDRKIKLAEVDEKQKKIEADKLDKRLREANEEMRKKFKRFEDAQENLEPDPWKEFGMGILGSLPQIFTSIGNEFTNSSKGVGPAIFDILNTGFTKGQAGMEKEIKENEEARIEAFEAQQNNGPVKQPGKPKVDTKSAYANKELIGVVRNLKQIGISINQFFYQKGQCSKSQNNKGASCSPEPIIGSLRSTAINNQGKRGKNADAVLTELGQGRKKINSKRERGSNKRLSDKAIKVIDILEVIVKDLKRMALAPGSDGKLGKSEYERFKKQREIIKEMIAIDLVAVDKTLPFKKIGPDDPKDETESATSALKGAYGQLEIAEKQYNKAVKDRELLMETERELSKTINELMLNLKNYELTEAQLDEQLAVMAKCIKVIEQLKKEWAKLVNYFQYFARQVDVTVGEPLTEFVRMGKANHKNKLYQDVANQLSKKMMYDLAYQTSIAAHNANKESGAYLQLSEDLFMPAVTKLGELIALDPVEDQYEIKFKKKELDQQATMMLSEIDRILDESEEDFKRTIQERIKSLHEKFKSEVEDKLEPDMKAKAPAIQAEAKRAVSLTGMF